MEIIGYFLNNKPQIIVASDTELKEAYNKADRDYDPKSLWSYEDYIYNSLEVNVSQIYFVEECEENTLNETKELVYSLLNEYN